MIRALRMERFKCFDTLTLPLSPLTLFTGFNAAGKSTALQTLLLLSQTLRGQRRSSELRLKGPLANLGTAADVINRVTGGNEVALGLTTDEGELLWRFSVNDDDRRSLKAVRAELVSGDSETRVVEAFEGIRPYGLKIPCQETLATLERLIFLSASRQLDTDLFPVPEDAEDTPGDVGPLGQFAAWWFHQGSDNPGLPSRSLKGQDATTLRYQVNAWAADLFPGVDFNAIPVSGTNQMRLEIKCGPTSGWTRPANIGYGISYAFPALVAGLMAPTGCVLIIDSPEAHLHPRGQAQMGGFLAQMASAGLQILIETHSDHVMDGVRIAIREGILKPEDAAFHYFVRDETTPAITTPQIDAEGRLSEWPEGFFDQHRRNMARLVRPKAS
jgi:energy-coupling factor transporter ATP-binding protein EcfA2